MYLGPKLVVLFLVRLGVMLFLVGFDMASSVGPLNVGGAEIGPDAVNSTAYSGLNGTFVTLAP